MEISKRKREFSATSGSVNRKFRCVSSDSSRMDKLKRLRINTSFPKFKVQKNYTHDNQEVQGQVFVQGEIFDSSRLKQLRTQATIDQDGEMSDTESSSTTSGSPKKVAVFDDIGLVKLDEEENGYQLIKKAFLGGMRLLEKHTEVVAVHKNSFMGLTEQTRLQSFRLFSEMMAKKRRSHGGNIKFAWYGTSKDGISKIISHGFGHYGKPDNNGLYGHGIYLSPHNSCLDSAVSSPIDEDGLRHVVLCRVILGNMEEILPGSDQCYPSGKIYDSGVDNILAPNKYIIWSTNMNTHILPEYVVSFKVARPAPSLPEQREPVHKPKSPWLALPTLIGVLARFITPDAIDRLKKYQSDYIAKKLSRQEMIQQIRLIAGDKLLISVIKSFQEQGQTMKTDTVPCSIGGLSTVV
ncbi:hypothetical protein ACHQM5_008319 [Ranunculus cassubicifolius]